MKEDVAIARSRGELFRDFPRLKFLRANYAD
jgi:hypothetical protein